VNRFFLTHHASDIEVMNTPTPPQEQPPENQTPPSPAEKKTLEPLELLDLALSQIATFLKNSGKNRLDALATEKDGYAQAIWLLEKVSKASLEWREQQRENRPTADPKKAGVSEETQKRFEEMLMRSKH
jgi:hypothetical protein